MKKKEDLSYTSGRRKNVYNPLTDIQELVHVAPLDMML
jgi:hypothetical protein